MYAALAIHFRIKLIRWTLIFIGITFASVSLYGGYQFSDPYQTMVELEKDDKTRKNFEYHKQT